MRCDRCGAEAEGRVNGLAFCADHFDDVLDLAVVLECCEKGAPVDVTERAVEWAHDAIVLLMIEGDEP